MSGGHQAPRRAPGLGGRGRDIPRASQKTGAAPWPPPAAPQASARHSPRWLLRAPTPRTGQTTNRSDGRHGPSSSGSARCSWSATTRRKRLSASSRCPHPPALHSGTVLILIFRSTAVKGKALLKQCEAAVLSQERQGKGSGAEHPGRGLQGGAAPPGAPGVQRERATFRLCPEVHLRLLPMAVTSGHGEWEGLGAGEGDDRG